MDVDVVIVNWNAGPLLEQCLESLNEFALQSISAVVLVDNASTDGSVEECNGIDLPIKVIRNRENRGFALACNQGAALCTAKYILFLNPDTRVFQNSLTCPIRFMENSKNAQVGICGIQLVDEQNNVSRTCMRFPAVGRFFAQATGLNRIPGMRGWGISMREWDHLASKEVEQVIGAFFFTRRALFEDLGGFDERFFVYFEEVDFSLRAKDAGWNTVYLSDGQAFHLGGGTTQQIKATRLFYSLRSRLLYGFKHFSLGKAWLLLAVTLVVEPIGRSFYGIFVSLVREPRFAFRDLKETWTGYAMIIGWLGKRAFNRMTVQFSRQEP
ncbi:MAG: glycosyltransferase family 2 protein [Woeseiaceae bacterium]